MPLPVCRASEVAIALDRASARVVHRWAGTAAEIVVRGAHPSVEDVNVRVGALVRAATVCAHTVQAPAWGAVWVGLQLGDHVHGLVGLNELDRGQVPLDERLQVPLGPTNVKESHTALVGVAAHLASLPGMLAKGSDLSICGLWLQSHNPLLLARLLKHAQTTRTSIRGVIIEHGHSCDELCAAVLMLLPRDARSLRARKEHGHRAQATRQGHHNFEMK